MRYNERIKLNEKRKETAGEITRLETFLVFHCNPVVPFPLLNFLEFFHANSAGRRRYSKPKQNKFVIKTDNILALQNASFLKFYSCPGSQFQKKNESKNEKKKKKKIE